MSLTIRDPIVELNNPLTCVKICQLDIVSHDTESHRTFRTGNQVRIVVYFEV